MGRVPAAVCFLAGFFARVGGDDKGRCWGGEEGEVRKVSFGGAGLFFVYIKNDLD